MRRGFGFTQSSKSSTLDEFLMHTYAAANRHNAATAPPSAPSTTARVSSFSSEVIVDSTTGCAITFTLPT